MAQVIVNEEPGLTGVTSSRDRWVEASHWKSIISLSSSESFACEREGMTLLLDIGGRPRYLVKREDFEVSLVIVSHIVVSVGDRLLRWPFHRVHQPSP